MIRQKIEIINKLGLHARAAAKFVTTASAYKSDVQLIKGEREVNGKSIMGVMMLAAAKGSILELVVNGDDEAAAVNKIIALIGNRFGEDE
ncbi:Phosphotransferase system, phosphocarrier protein HPr [hydrothermal vent metagenome]|uniref:Phosphotransferase system, phosphocarrier protein HPr n=1 Tax=hydrothermal vent metagenome TaxID=652676 RepID=A0A3B0ZJM0_9ZZZZ